MDSNSTSGTPSGVPSGDWLAVSLEARETMQDLGNFTPTIVIANREVKGRPEDTGKTYWNSDELRRMAKHFIEVADWLDARAANTSDEPRPQRK